VLLFVHTGAWSFIWRDLMKHLALDFRCVSFDAPGNGRSSSIPRSQTTLENAARAAAGLVERLDLENLTIVAHDLGGISGLARLARMPERVAGIVAMNTFGWRPSAPALRAMLAIMASKIMREIDALTNIIPRIASTSFGVGRHLDAASRRAFRAGLQEGPAAPSAITFWTPAAATNCTGR
jgi:haloalkane dehalogenase